MRGKQGFELEILVGDKFINMYIIPYFFETKEIFLAVQNKQTVNKKKCFDVPLWSLPQEKN